MNPIFARLLKRQATVRTVDVYKRQVDTFTEEVLSETTLLTFKHIGKRFKSTVVGALADSGCSRK